MTVDLTQILIAVIGGVFSIVGAVFLAWLQAHIKDEAARAAITAAVKNSLGAAQQAVQQGVEYAHPEVTIPGVSPAMAAAVGYVLTQEGPAVARLADMTQEKIAGKIEAQLGLVNIATNQAIAASPSPATPSPLDPVTGAPPVLPTPCIPVSTIGENK